MLNIVKNKSIYSNKKQRISWQKEGKQPCSKNDFLDTFLDLCMHFSHWRAFFVLKWHCGKNTVRTFKIPRILGILSEANILNFPRSHSVAQRGQMEGRAMLVQRDLIEKHHLVSKQLEFELAVADI